MHGVLLQEFKAINMKKSYTNRRTRYILAASRNRVMDLKLQMAVTFKHFSLLPENLYVKKRTGRMAQMLA